MPFYAIDLQAYVHWNTHTQVWLQFKLKWRFLDWNRVGAIEASIFLRCFEQKKSS